MNAAIDKAESELQKIEGKYHDSTKDVELTRQACDAEMRRVKININQSEKLITICL